MKVTISANVKTWERVADALVEHAGIREALDHPDVREEQFLREVAGQISKEVRQTKERRDEEFEACRERGKSMRKMREG